MRLITILLFTLLLTFFAKAQNASTADSVKIYTVKPGDTLSKLARNHFNRVEAWDLLYRLNKEMINNPDLIYPGQELKIPVSKNYAAEQPAEDENENEAGENSLKVKEDVLEKFRNAFKEVVKSENVNEKESGQTKEAFQPLNAGGMILDESRSKMGSDFYNIFYTNWKSPSEQYSFTITVSERPTPSLGTVVMVQVDGQNVYQNRLEPRYHKIEEAANNAIQMCQQFLKIKMLDNDSYHGI